MAPEQQAPADQAPAKPTPAKPTISFLDVLRRNRVGNLVAGLIVMFAAALLLSAAVPNDLNIVIEILLILLLAAAVGFTVRVTSPDQGAATLVTAAILAAVGTPILFVTGVSPGSFGAAMLASFQSGFVAVGAALAAIVAVICAGWGQR